MRKIEIHGISECRIEWGKLFDAFQILRALTEVEAHPLNSVILLLHQLLLEKCFSLDLLFKELTVAPFRKSRPLNAVEGFPLYCYLREFCRSLLHTPLAKLSD